MAGMTMNKIIALVLIILVIATVVMFILKPEILEHIRQLPEYRYDVDEEIEINGIDEEIEGAAGMAFSEEGKEERKSLADLVRQCTRVDLGIRDSDYNTAVEIGDGSIEFFSYMEIPENAKQKFSVSEINNILNEKLEPGSYYISAACFTEVGVTTFYSRIINIGE